MVTEPSEDQQRAFGFQCSAMSLEKQNSALEAEVERLRQRLLTAAGDDLCRLTQEEIKAMSAGGVQIPPKEEFLASCERFHAQIAGETGVNQNCLTLAQLIAENERLQGAVKELEAKLDDQVSLGFAMEGLLREAMEIGQRAAKVLG